MSLLLIVEEAAIISMEPFFNVVLLQGLYAELDIHRKIPPPKPQRTDIVDSPTSSEEAVTYINVNPYARPRIPAKVYVMQVVVFGTLTDTHVIYVSLRLQIIQER